MGENKKIKNKIKKLMIAMGITTLLSTLAIAGVLLYYAQIDTNVNVNNLIEINGQPAENLQINININMYPGETNTTTYTILSHKDTNINFLIDSPDIITTINNGMTTLSMTAETIYYLDINYYCPNNLTSGSYYSNITIQP